MKKSDKYFSVYAEPEVKLLTDFPRGSQFENSFVIPAYNESPDFLKSLVNSAIAHKQVLLILVLNQPSYELDNHRQLELQHWVLQKGQTLWSKNNLQLVQLYNCKLHILLVDRFNKNVICNQSQNVGLARKTGTDIAACLIKNKLILSDWIGSTDADVQLPDSYFSALNQIGDKTSAVVYGFQHIDQANNISSATKLYEQALRYYVSGLRWAGSSYAYHTIGSILSLNVHHYLKVRGFPKKDAGEDFYLLNKLNKEAPVKELNNVTILIRPRISNRVPFGTGPAVEKILHLDNYQTDYRYYHPELFIELKNTLTQLNKLWSYKNDLEGWFELLSENSVEALRANKFDQLLIHLNNNCNTKVQYRKQVFLWFDSFKTLKFLHYLQHQFYPPISLYKALEYAPFKIE